MRRRARSRKGRKPREMPHFSFGIPRLFLSLTCPPLPTAVTLYGPRLAFSGLAMWMGWAIMSGYFLRAYAALLCSLADKEKVDKTNEKMSNRSKKPRRRRGPRTKGGSWFKPWDRLAFIFVCAQFASPSAR